MHVRVNGAVGMEGAASQIHYPIIEIEQPQKYEKGFNGNGEESRTCLLRTMRRRKSSEKRKHSVMKLRHECI